MLRYCKRHSKRHYDRKCRLGTARLYDYIDEMVCGRISVPSIRIEAFIRWSYRFDGSHCPEQLFARHFVLN